MSDQMLTTLQAALQQLASQQTAATLGDRSTYLGASDIGACPRKTILGKLQPPEADLITLLRHRRGHMAEEIVAGNGENWLTEMSNDQLTRIFTLDL